ncbi:MAG: SDR family NAD(P)-dependent oxidoreductase [Burkholderia sp.]|jgi:NAD(P)-dependent dehydrogenase (short-subunit alcohol dehydrogenase family)|uniref:oxidoreductase n=1 Tax=Burkholderia sp. TaxID=36773 RepID=UPI00258E8156|nr:oxidoreductase [Burkholderia sp.]MCA3780108.1 SDR family NAD(P)-dependent oxidoreductase [Burkholderia sp.]MCA3784073.1 SDR family NAD(P)-dependent oxidoreductase [Burkholderia sp.]MCA3793318.1 SDR family NAD(P)-dependent oxidoreductase [Burkholderia sp.]MCA3805316.1 SDR family NAD(P)-dependent oxidoreductase [Burkholderia sp.]MCA3818950.1 SDR family NAD(P)-dependent oxidoreductase [Burkholderia sp.]
MAACPEDSVWFVTGSSSGLGRELAEQALARGWRVVLAVRQPDAVASLAGRYPDTAMTVLLDVTDPASVAAAVAAAQARFGHIDVLANAAGYGYLAAIEEGEDHAIRAQFETNVFGLLAVTRAVLPGMRARRRGRIANFSSLGGLVAFAATGYYHATKFAVEALSESLSHEVAPLGIAVTIVEPGAFRTEWAGRSMVASDTEIDDYAPTAGKRRAATRAVSGHQPGDPVKGAAAVIAALESDAPPLRLLLGKAALDVALKRLDALRTNFEAWRDLTEGTDFPAA